MRFIHGFLPAGHEDWDKVVFIDEMNRSLAGRHDDFMRELCKAHMQEKSLLTFQF